MNTITLQLNRLDDLFNETAFSSERLDLQSGPGIEHIVNQLRLRRNQEVERLVMRLTAEMVTPERQQQAARALQKFCLMNATKNYLEAKLIRRSGWQALQIGLIALAVLLALSASVGHLKPLPLILNSFLSNGFMIVGWVVLWHPVEMLLYDWVAPYRLAKIYEHISRMELELHGTETSNS